eukprot:1556384-Amphidinium_carterae.1
MLKCRDSVPCDGGPVPGAGCLGGTNKLPCGPPVPITDGGVQLVVVELAVAEPDLGLGPHRFEKSVLLWLILQPMQGPGVQRVPMMVELQWG